ncbi:MAG: hypothetical protein ABJH07_23075 [Sedimentitalea sp.]|uniref:lipoate--protein ligase family protein n=1 Tax=Sedimentitalea sp. TaxID=2048915 RepID=UPI003266032B
MICVTFDTADDGNAREEALFAAGDPAVLLWQAQAPSLVVPRSRARKPGFDALREDAACAGWPILLRTSGGGAVPQGPGTLNIAMVARMPCSAHIEHGYRLICGAIAEALARFEVPTQTGAVNAAFCDGDWNVTVGGRKLVGTAQRWRPAGGGRSLALMHAAIVIDHPPISVWPVLGDVEAHAGGVIPPRRDVHVSLNELLPEKMRPAAIHGALMRAAEDRLRALDSLRTEEAVAA